MRTEAKELVRPLANRLAGAVHGAHTDDPVVSFTFDDGPDEVETPRILAALADHGARATFFVIGQRALRYPELVRRIRSEGHEVGSHADVHRALTGIPLREVLRRIRRGKRGLERVLDEPVRLFRPPFGFLSRGGHLAARACSLEVVSWSAAAEDWRELPVDDLVRLGLQRLAPGGILLLHERHEPLPVPDPPPEPGFDREQLVRALLGEASSRGWRSVTVGDLLSGRAADRRLSFRSSSAHPGGGAGAQPAPSHER
jgi:peptidoglycan/xylan/chitin deacetylase (PgdA/CDA1 family)